ncbi:hypothetical protein CPLU01_10551 [Colletotrichum plurivorum]|uniref:Uncharacterized protein n=1 Tax=Colletotrichum plurivorum TaxID=2175906 RepID=A0A8H6K664_9PEZI|nr:hypothetical protein CPLU01_10551 [Colletotrichum plurivorum]
MDNTPLHPDIVTLPQDSAGTRHGDFLAAVPYNRSMYRSTLCLRASSVLVGVMILGTLASQDGGDEFYVMGWCLGSPTAALGILWSCADVGALVVRDRGVRWTKDTGRRQRSTRFSWGHPGGHVAGHLIIWTATAALLGVVAKIFMEYNMEAAIASNARRAHVMTALLFFMFWLMVIHFALFVFACVEVDNIRRQYRDVVFVPRGELREMVPVPPTTPMEIFVPRRMTLSFFANHYVRFVPGADGTVTVARDYSSRQARF